MTACLFQYKTQVKADSSLQILQVVWINFKFQMAFQGGFDFVRNSFAFSKKNKEIV